VLILVSLTPCLAMMRKEARYETQKYYARVQTRSGQVGRCARCIGVPGGAGFGHGLQRHFAVGSENKPDKTQEFPGRGQTKSEDAEIARLKRELQRTKAERDILKKTIGVFVKNAT
jgi:hypothetical protein